MRRGFINMAIVSAILAASAPAIASGNTKEAVNHLAMLRNGSYDKSPLIGAGNANPFRHNRTPKGNQRQYRKWLRQNPHMRNTKKVKR